MTKTLSDKMRAKALEIMDSYFKGCSSNSYYANSSRTASPASWIILSMDVDGSLYKDAIKRFKENEKGLADKDKFYEKFGYFPTPMTLAGFITKGKSVKFPTGRELPVEDLIHLHQTSPYAPCHGSFPQKITGEAIVVGSNFDYLPNEDHASKYLSYLVDLKVSPYRSLLCHGFNVHYSETGHTAGISIFLEDVPAVMRPMIKNFFIACRMARECPKYVSNFCDMVDAGLDPRLAHLLMSQVSKKKDADKWVVSPTAGKNTGHHWPISLGASDYGFSISRFWNSDLCVEKATGRVNGLFAAKSNAENLSGGELNGALNEWRKTQATKFAPDSIGIIDKIESLNNLLIGFFKEKKGLEC